MSNILLIGPTGLARPSSPVTLAYKILNVARHRRLPRRRPSRYVGEDVDS